MLRRFLIILIFSIAALGFVPNVQAVAISPLKQHITLAPGAVNFTVSVTIKNEEGEKTNYDLKVLGARQLENGAIVYGHDNSAAEIWVKPEKNSIEIKQDEEVNANFLVSVPIDAVAGSYVLGLVAEPIVSENDTAVGVSAQVASVLLLQVAGVVNESLTVDKYNLPALTISRQWPAIVELKNIGTTELPIRGAVSVSDWLGREVYKEELNFGQVLLPGSGRSYGSELNIKNKFLLPGPYHTELSVSYGLTNQKTYKAENTWHLPVYFWVILLIILFSIIYKIFRHKKLNK